MNKDEIRNRIWRACQSTIPMQEYDIGLQDCMVASDDVIVITVTCVKKRRIEGGRQIAQ